MVTVVRIAKLGSLSVYMELRVELVSHTEKSAHVHMYFCAWMCAHFCYVAVHGQRAIKRGFFSIIAYLPLFSPALRPSYLF